MDWISGIVSPLIRSACRRFSIHATSAQLCAIALLCVFSPILAAAPASDNLLELPIVAVESVLFTPAELPAIQRSLGLLPGRVVDVERLDSGLRSLYGQGGIQFLFVEAVAEGRGIRVFIRGAKLRKLRSINFKNVEPEIADDLRRKLNLEEGETTDNRTFGLLKERIKESCEERGFYYAQVEIKVTDVPETQEADVEVVVTKGEPTIVSRVNIIGATKEESERLRDLVTLKKGSTYAKATLDENVEAIAKYLRDNQYPTSKIEGTNLNFTEDKKVVEVNILVKLGEKFQFEFVGNSVFSDLELREILTSEMLSQTDSAAKVSELIEKKYQAVGYHFCKVIAKNLLNEADRINIVRFDVSEGAKVIVDRVEFKDDGEDFEESLEDLFYEGAPGILARGIYWEEGMDEALRKLKAKLETKGFLSTAVSSPRTIFSDDKKGVQLFFDIDLGSRTFVAESNLEGASQIPKEELEPLVTFKTGDPFNRERVKESRKKIIEYYQSKGFSDVAMEEDKTEGVAISTDRKRATVNMRVKEGQRYFVGAIRIQGVRKTRDEVVRREMKLAPGDVYNPKLVQRSEEDVALLGLFSRVEILTTPSGQANNQKDLTVVVRETRPGLGEVGLGGFYEEPRLRLRAFFGIAYRNLMGLNQTATARSEVSLPLTRTGTDNVIPFVEYAALLGYRAPYPFSLPFTYSAQVGLDSYEVSTIGPRLQTRARIENRIERKLTPTLTGIYRLHRYERTYTEVLASATTVASEQVDTIGSTGPGIILDFRDDIFNPTRGSLHTADLEFAHPAILSQSEPTKIGFVMAITRNSVYVPLFSPFALSFYGGVGYARSILSGSPLPTARLAYDLALGGQTSIRGFSPRIFSPVKQNQKNPEETAFYNARSELTIYLFANISAALFIDTGQIFPGLRAESRHDGVGFGVRYKTPVGPIVVDIAQGLGPDRESLKFYFTVGTF